MQKRGIFLLFLTTSLISSDLKKVTIEEELNSQTIKDISSHELKSADLGDALFKNVASIDMIRRSGIANDILLRGQKRDNINVIVDGAKIYGACVNRMDPPISHVLTNNIDYVRVSEGPFDVENFGTLSGLVSIKTKKPTKKLKGSVGINLGSFGYQKWYGDISGGSDKIKILLSASTEKSDQYKDGNGDNFYDQIQKNIDKKIAPPSSQFQNRYKDMDAYTKSTLLSKIYIDLSKNQELRFSYTANRSDDILYPSTKMDAVYDNSDIYNLQYIIQSLGIYSKKLEFQAYNSKVDHPMSTRYRIAGAKKEKTHHLKTDMKAFKIKNYLDTVLGDTIFGLDYSKRNWDGIFTSNNKALKMKNGILAPKSINDVDTKNIAFFAKTKDRISNKLTLDYGCRVDDTKIDSASAKEPSNDYRSISLNIFADYKVDDDLNIFGGIGNSNRVPDARELYLLMMGNHYGTPNLKQSKNYEIDLGFKKIFDKFSIKLKTYYSFIKDYIAFNSSNKGHHSFENVDADIYGGEISGDWLIDDNLYIDYAINYKRGKKRDPLNNQKGKNLPNIRPLKSIISLNYEDEKNSAKIEFIGSTKWDKIDIENGEQELKGYGVINLKADHKFRHNLKLSLGIDNLLDKTYTTANTYKDLNLLTTGTTPNSVMLLNEPGRYFYANVEWGFWFISIFFIILPKKLSLLGSIIPIFLIF